MTTTGAPQLARALYERYYRAPQSEAAEALTSSHWRRFGGETVVEFDDAGAIVRMRGAGFGKLDHRLTLPNALLYRLTALAYLAQLPSRRERLQTLAAGRDVARRAGLGFNLESFRQVCSLQMLQSAIEREGIQPDRVLIIGDGYGFSASLWKRLFPKSRLVLVDLGRTLLFQVVTAQRVHADARHQLVLDGVAADANADFVYCPAEHLPALDGLTFDVAINTMSMQEMNEATIAGYFTFLRARMRAGRHLFYCLNRELKVLEGGERADFFAYPWLPEDRHLIDEICPWWRYRFSKHTSDRGPRVAGVRVPFVNYFKPVRHRLTVLATTAAARLS